MSTIENETGLNVGPRSDDGPLPRLPRRTPAEIDDAFNTLAHTLTDEQLDSAIQRIVDLQSAARDADHYAAMEQVTDEIRTFIAFKAKSRQDSEQ